VLQEIIALKTSIENSQNDSKQDQQTKTLDLINEEDVKDKFDNFINLASLSKKIQKRIKVIDNLLARLKFNQKVYFFFGHTGVGM
jgi:hypothetical protein